MKIKTNYVPRNVIFGFELTEKEKEEFDYYSESQINERSFFRYKGNVYDVGDMMPNNDLNRVFQIYWDAYINESFFSGIVIHFALLYRDWETDRKSTRLNSSHRSLSRMPSSA